jgi:tRNA-dihydrouridine synthase
MQPVPSDPQHTLCLAPMRGVTTCTYRTLIQRHFPGLDRAMAPFIPTVHSKITRKLLRDVLPENNPEPLPLIPQVIGRDPQDILALTQALHDLGYPETNWNLGCPWPQVVKKKRGSGLLPYPDMIREVLDLVCSRSQAAFSVKVRLGTDNQTDLTRLLPLFNDYPLSEIIIHPRTASQMYEGTVDLDAFERCLAHTSLPVCYNGDIYTVEILHIMQQRFPQVQRWMIGRGAIQNPMLAAEIKGRYGVADPAQRLQDLRNFHDALYHTYSDILYGPASILGKMKEFWSYLAHSFPDPQRTFKRIRKTQQLPAYEVAVDHIFSHNDHLVEPNIAGREY